MLDEPNDQQTILILTASGGGGLLQAAMAKKQKILAANPNANVVTIDVMLQWLGLLGKFGAGWWNLAQKKGDVGSQVLIGKLQRIGDRVLWPVIFFRMLYFLSKNNVIRVLDTQPLGTSAIIKAIRIINRLRNKAVYLEKILVDLPTKANTHFFHGIKRLKQADKNALRVVSIEPLLEDEADANSFWQKHCGISEAEVIYEGYYIRRGFIPYIGKKRNLEAHEIVIRTEDDREDHYVGKVCAKGPIVFYKEDIGYRFIVKPEDKLFVVLLGSQPCFEATTNYVKNFIHLIKTFGRRDRHYHLFVFCSKYRDNKKNLFKHIHDLIEDEFFYPTNFSIIPMSFQDSESIAAIFHRADIAITRSGGQTMMELMGVAHGEKWVHSETKKLHPSHVLSTEQLLKGIPAWEAGNAVYLSKKHNGKLVTPEILVDQAKHYL